MNRQVRAIILILILAFAGYVFFQKEINKGLDLQGGMRLVLEAQDTKEYAVDNSAVLGILGVIRQRINAYGVSEPLIQRKGLRQVIVELPGVKDPDRAISLIGETALLEFVEAEWAPENIFSLSKDKQEILIGKDVKIDKVINYDRKGNIISERPIILKNSVLKGADLKSADPGTDNFGRPIVNIEFKPDAAKIFYESTIRQTGKPIAIILDGRIISAPNVKGPIAGGRAFVEGNFSVQEMRDLVIKLKAGSLPVPVEIISNRIVGPTLGRDSIEKSKIAGIVGIILIWLYMIYLYRFSGLVADMALCIYLLLVMSILKLFDATLTLPGIAGIILTIGMAVDANVIIFERIKEEIRVGESIRSAISLGFKKGIVAVLDANITTLMAAIVLFWLGTGSIKGFALTLTIGILVSMFSAIFVTKLLLEVLAGVKKLSGNMLFKV